MSLELDLARLKNDLSTQTFLEDEASTELQLTSTEKEREVIEELLKANAQSMKNLLDRMSALSDIVRTENRNIAELNEWIEALEKALAAERAKVETVQIYS